MTQRLFLRKTDKAKREENPKLPYFTLVVPPEDDEDAKGEWQEVGALWPAKSGNGYSGKTSDGVEIVFEEQEGKSTRGTKSGKKSSEEDEPGEGED